MSLHFARPVHPGEYLREEYLIPLRMSAGVLAKRLDVPRSRIERIVREEIGITADTALRLARFFRTTPEFWMNFQKAFEIETEAKALSQTLDAIVPIEEQAVAA